MRPDARDRQYHLAVAGVALVLLLVGSLLPLWKMTLHAPQYPGGLRLVIGGRGIAGDVDELNALNHYIGMAAIREEEIPEVRLFYPAVAAIALGLVLGLVVPWPWFRWLVTVGLWALPLAFLADLQWRLHIFGHTLDPAAAFRLPAFTPMVIGQTIVMNFNVTALPGAGLVLLLAAALIFTFGPRLWARRAAATVRRTARTVAGAAVAACYATTLLAHAPAVAAGGAAATAPADFDLHAAIATAPPGAVIRVPAGRYAGPLLLSRPVTLLGVGRPVIDGEGRGDVVVITADDVRLEGFTVRGSSLVYSREASGVVVRGARAVVRDNDLAEVLFGIYLADVRGAVVEGNTIHTAALSLERRGHAIYLWRAQDSRIRGNRILRGKDGIYVSFSEGNLVEENLVTGCRYGIHYMYSNNNTFRANVFRDNLVGAAVMYSSDVILDRNTFEGSRSSATGAGLIVKDADRLRVRENRIVGNRIGVEADGVPASIGGWARLERNVIAFNEIGLSLMSTTAMTVTENVIVENLRAVEARGRLRADANQWASGGRGNHWGDYTGFDAQGDGVGDVPYRRADLLEDLAGRTPALQAFLFTPAHLALETAARLVPLAEREPIVMDPAPLVRPPVRGAGAGPSVEGNAAGRSGGPAGPALLWVGLGMLLPAASAVYALRPSGRRL